MYTLRPPQQRAMSDIRHYLDDPSDFKKVVVVAPVAAGKSLLIAKTAEYVKDGAVLSLSPSKEL